MEPNDRIPNTPNDNPPNTNQPQKPKTPTSRRSRKILYISLAILLIFLGLGAGLSLFSTNSKDAYNNPLDNPMVQQMAEKLPIPKITMTLVTLAPSPTFAINPLTPQPTQAPAVNYQSWKTYNNKTFNFSINYPSNLNIDENDHGLGVLDIAFTNAANADTQDSIADYQILIYPSAVEKFIGHDFNTLYSLPANTTERMSAQSMQPQLYTKVKNRTIDNHRGFDFEATNDPPDPYVEVEAGTYIDLGKSRMIISTGKSNRATLDQMLINFKSPIK
jgi:hypothetical protein